MYGVKTLTVLAQQAVIFRSRRSVTLLSAKLRRLIRPRLTIGNIDASPKKHTPGIYM